MAKPREVRGWLVYGTGVAVAFLMLAFRFHYVMGGVVAPYFLVPWVDVPLVIAILAGALAAAGLHQALWSFLVRPGGMVLYLASLLMFVVATLFLFALPSHFAATAAFFYPMFTAAVVLYVYVPTLSYESRAFLGIAIVGTGALLAASLYGPLMGAAPLTSPVILATVASEGLLLLLVLRLLQLTMQKPEPVAA